MEKLTKHFARHEFACKCGKCGRAAVDYELINVIEECIAHFEQLVGKPYISCTINSGNRCPEHNAAEGGEPNSKHLYGIAADIVLEGIPSDDVYEYLSYKYPNKYGIGRYKGRTHIDVRPAAARWAR